MCHKAHKNISVIKHTLIKSAKIQSCIRIKSTISQEKCACFDNIEISVHAEEQNRTVLNSYVIEIYYYCCRPSNDLITYVTKLHK